MLWIGCGSPVNMKRLKCTRYTDYLNSTLVHLAVHTVNSDLLSILLQHGADVNAFDANGCNPLVLALQSSIRY